MVEIRTSAVMPVCTHMYCIICVRIVPIEAWLSETICGPITKARAVPTLLPAMKMDVAVVRWSGGNHVAESTGPATMAMGPANPLRICPRCMSPVAASDSKGKLLARAPKKHSPDPTRHVHLKLRTTGSTPIYSIQHYKPLCIEYPGAWNDGHEVADGPLQ